MSYGLPYRFIIYSLENTCNGMVYVGRTRHMTIRMQQHAGVNSPTRGISDAIGRYGIDSFMVKELDGCEDYRESFLLERFWIHLLEANDPRFGYNSSTLYRVHIDMTLFPLVPNSRSLSNPRLAHHLGPNQQ